MKVEFMYLPVEVKWEHAEIEKFNGKNREFDPIYTLGITPPDPADRNCVLFNVWVEKRIQNLDKKKDVFFAKIYYCFRVRNESQRPTIEFYYDLIRAANIKFSETITQKTQGTNLQGITSFCPPLDFLLKDIKKTIDFWDENHRYASLN